MKSYVYKCDICEKSYKKVQVVGFRVVLGKIEIVGNCLESFDLCHKHVCSGCCKLICEHF